MVWRGVKDVCKESYASFNSKFCSEKAVLVLNLGASVWEVPATRMTRGHQGPTLWGESASPLVGPGGSHLLGLIWLPGEAAFPLAQGRAPLRAE